MTNGNARLEKANGEAPPPNALRIGRLIYHGNHPWSSDILHVPDFYYAAIVEDDGGRLPGFAINDTCWYSRYGGSTVKQSSDFQWIVVDC